MTLSYRFVHREGRRNCEATAAAPWSAGLSSTQAELIALASSTDINGSLWPTLRPAGRAHAPRIAALLCVDPFLRPRDRGDALRAAGIAEIVNLPSVSLIDGEAGKALDSTGYGWRQEIEQLARFKQDGFAVNVVVRDQRAARLALALSPHRLILHPGLPPMDAAARRKAVAAVVRHAGGLRGCDAAVLIYRPHGFAREFAALGRIDAGSVTLQQSSP